jgi:hypothetical protein
VEAAARVEELGHPAGLDHAPDAVEAVVSHVDTLVAALAAYRQRSRTD